MTDVTFERIIFYFTEWQPSYSQLGGYIEFHEGLPKNSDYESDPCPKLLILDDLMHESNSKSIISLFTKGCHHRNLSVIFISQNIFHKGLREISLNSSYIVFFKNPRDSSSIRYLARQIYPEKSKYVIESYVDATSKPYGYLLIDLKQSTPSEYRLRTDIFPDQFQIFYLPKK